MILNDRQIIELCRTGMIVPYESGQVKYDDFGRRRISYGPSSFGYDARVADEFMVFHNLNSTMIDPKADLTGSFLKVKGDHVVIPPNSFALARTVEYIKVPEDVIVICIGKSTYARCGIVVNVTPLEPGWEGEVTVEISNTTPLPAKIYSNEGIMQMVFLRGEKPNVTYSSREGKYMRQKGITLPRV